MTLVAIVSAIVEMVLLQKQQQMLPPMMVEATLRPLPKAQNHYTNTLDKDLWLLRETNPKLVGALAVRPRKVEANNEAV